MADVRLPHVLGSNMVVQRDQPIQVWGWADPGERIQVRFAGQRASVRAGVDGKWTVSLKALPAGGPHIMEIRGRNTLLLDNILMGDVWVASGQSNMQWRLSLTENAEQAIEEADHPKIRLFTVPRRTSTVPLHDTAPSQWYICTPESADAFSAVAYYFGRKLNQELDVPIGLINTSWGGTNVETWMTAETLTKIKGLEGVVQELKDYDPNDQLAGQKEKFRDLLGDVPEIDEGYQRGIAYWAAPDYDFTSWKIMVLPGLWEEKGLPNLDGIVWFMKEFELSHEEASSPATLSLGPIDDSDITWVNGIKVGETTNKYSEAREYQVPAYVLKEGRNVLVVRVEDTGGGGGIYGSEEQLYLKSSSRYHTLSGNWKYKVGKISFTSTLGPNQLPSLLFNAMIYPLLQLHIKGAIWYQGESNAGRAYQYRQSFPMMIQDWRDHWKIGDFPFLFVQLANFKATKEEPGESDWAELREAQSMTLALPNTGMAVIIDIGEANDIHPRNKLDVGLRLAQSALNVAYGYKDIVHSGPVFKSMKVEGNSIRIRFDHVGSGLVIKDRYGYLKGFSVAGKDKKFHWAKAKIEGDEVVVYSDEVKEPVAVRYGWADNPDDLNLYNHEGFPASPFRSDDWPGITAGKSYR
ncbi:MAG: sialate O-acetylesterase [Cyclobacteriaceae bacterium]|nr:sialate O-acetylesterase [Cyclobacteriaceae bacterium]